MYTVNTIPLITDSDLLHRAISKGAVVTESVNVTNIYNRITHKLPPETQVFKIQCGCEVQLVLTHLIRARSPSAMWHF